jgi:hypothetical protein
MTEWLDWVGECNSPASTTVVIMGGFKGFAVPSSAVGAVAANMKPFLRSEFTS